MRITSINIILAACFAAIGSIALAQSPIVTLALNPDKIAVVKSAPGITTRISFAEQVKEIICGDLYDSVTGKGGFVVQKSDKDVFLKPVATRGMSNLFVKTGEAGEHIYNFDLEIVAAPTAYRIVYVAADANSVRQLRAAWETSQPLSKEQPEEVLRNARMQADEIIHKANKQAEDVARQAHGQADEILNQASQNGQKQMEQSFADAVLAGIGEVRATHVHAVSKSIGISVARRLLTFNGKSYMQFSIQNNGAADFVYTAVSVQTTLGDETKLIPVEVFQTKRDGKVNKGEKLTGVVVFDANLVGPKDKLSMTLRGEDDTELARVIVMK